MTLIYTSHLHGIVINRLRQATYFSQTTFVWLAVGFWFVYPVVAGYVALGVVFGWRGLPPTKPIASLTRETAATASQLHRPPSEATDAAAPASLMEGVQFVFVTRMRTPVFTDPVKNDLLATVDSGRVIRVFISADQAYSDFYVTRAGRVYAITKDTSARKIVGWIPRTALSPAAPSERGLLARTHMRWYLDPSDILKGGVAAILGLVPVVVLARFSRRVRKNLGWWIGTIALAVSLYGESTLRVGAIAPFDLIIPDLIGTALVGWIVVRATRRKLGWDEFFPDGV
jgi:hypothetical protein